MAKWWCEEEIWFRPLFVRGHRELWPSTRLACDCPRSELCTDQFRHGVTLFADARWRLVSADHRWLVVELKMKRRLTTQSHRDRVARRRRTARWWQRRKELSARGDQ